jgi:hypothetical protein
MTCINCFHAEWSTPTQVPFRDVNGNTVTATQVQIASNVSLHDGSRSDIRLTFDALLFPNQVEVPLYSSGNLTLQIPAKALKFSVKIENWPFMSRNNTLR